MRRRPGQGRPICPPCSQDRGFALLYKPPRTPFTRGSQLGGCRRMDRRGGSDMFGFVIGTICLVALFKLARARRRWSMVACGYGPGPQSWHGHGRWGGGGWEGDPRGGWGGWGGARWVGWRGGFESGALRHLFHALETTPG